MCNCTSGKLEILGSMRTLSSGRAAPVIGRASARPVGADPLASPRNDGLLLLREDRRALLRRRVGLTCAARSAQIVEPIQQILPDGQISSRFASLPVQPLLQKYFV